MKNECVCPQCKGKKIYVCDNAQPGEESSNVIRRFHVVTVPISQQQTGAAEGSRYRSHVGNYETWICAGCGFTEWYAKDPERLLEKLSQMPDSGVRVLSGSSPTGSRPPDAR